MTDETFDTNHFYRGGISGISSGKPTGSFPVKNIREGIMLESVTAYIIAAGAVTLAEMGDKTQLLAMAFASKYKASKVLLGVFIATILNHACAVAVGNIIAKNQTIEVWIQIAASLSFILFGLWTIRGDKLDGKENIETRFGAVTTVAIAFFLAELGDKTQLATIALSTKFPDNPVAILVGSTTGMLIADSIGIFVSVIMCKKIPERTIKLVSAGVFILFGILGSYKVADEKLNLDHGVIIAVICSISVVTALLALYLIKKSSAQEKIQQNFCEPKNDL
jgi:Ca2+/H+ antiporter, TMEM165/GDT1 family